MYENQKIQEGLNTASHYYFYNFSLSLTLYAVLIFKYLLSPTHIMLVHTSLLLLILLPFKKKKLPQLSSAGIVNIYWMHPGHPFPSPPIFSHKAWMRNRQYLDNMMIITAEKKKTATFTGKNLRLSVHRRLREGIM